MTGVQVTKAEWERGRREEAKALGEHVLACERRYGEQNERFARIEANTERTLRLVYILLGGMLAVATKSFWPGLFGG